MFTALKQERLVFHNAMAGISLTTPVRVPVPLPSDRLVVFWTASTALGPALPSHWSPSTAYGRRKWRVSGSTTSTSPA
ncbi:hypothetical protein [Kitasatospora sp. NPDC057936]|uniref:hypothetical protein n=1 Tax=Kitasatospora sp. NPDC057936 TaxID=3346283 RepID=UPI0036DEE494